MKYDLGYYYLFFKQQLAQLPIEAQRSVKLLGQQNRENLLGLYNACDLFGSLSLYHDEDYGMSPAEALSCGLPAILSDWGGYSSFADDKKICELIPVRLSKSGPEISSSHISSALFKTSMKQHSDETRLAQSQHYHGRLSVESVAERYLRVLSAEVPKFEGFGNLMRQYMKKFVHGVPYSQGPKAGTFYERIYRNYV
jgi:glycosyltransferase involved in cell wall biosynthesis